MGEWQRTEWVDLMLDELETWAVVGLSGDPSRTAYSIARLLQQRGKRIVPIHPRFVDDPEAEVLGERGFPTLADVPFAIAVAVGAKAVWFQLGVIDAEAFRRTIAAGVPMVMDTCPAIEWRHRAA